LCQKLFNFKSHVGRDDSTQKHEEQTFFYIHAHLLISFVVAYIDINVESNLIIVILHAATDLHRKHLATMPLIIL